MKTFRTKILKRKNAQTTQLDRSVAQALVAIEQSNTPIAPRVVPLKICGARQFDVGQKKKALIVFIPYPQLANYHRIQTQLVSELEKKFAGKHVFIVAKRRILAKPARGHKYSQPRPRSRTMAAVHEKILDDLV
jgi:small subunit ribosomal protein S7e